MNDTHQELRDLITDIVTGGGEQRENIEMTDAEWEESFKADPDANAVGQVNITMSQEDWMAMVRVARNNSE